MTAGRGVACYSSEFTFKSLLTRMHSIGLDLSDAPKGVKLTVESLEDPLPDDDCDVILAALVETMQNVGKLARLRRLNLWRD